MRWEDCVKEKVKEVKPNLERAKSMRDLAVKRLESIRRRRGTDDPEFIVEDYYEAMKELITAMLFSRGFKSYSHECLITFLREFHKEFKEDELQLIDQMRQTRNDLLYRGEPVAAAYLNRREPEFTTLIAKLLDAAARDIRV
jgi:uncharacterized protein (UPF0332 family)